MNLNDVVFKKIAKGEIANPASFCYYGWEGTDAFAFGKYAKAYYDSAEVLYEKFENSAGDNATLDSLGITMCFLYRHFVELSIKCLYVNFVCQSEDEYKAFLEKGHNLYELWHETKPKLSELKKRVGSSVDIGALEHYIMEFDRFDKDSMAMRYPIKKNLTPMHESTRLDIFNLHDRVLELYCAFEAIVYDLDNQMGREMSEEKVEAFLMKYDELRPRIHWLLTELTKFVDKEEEEFTIKSFSDDILNVDSGQNQIDLLMKCSDDELIMYDTLYYTGRTIQSGSLRLPKNPHEAKTDTVKMCIINMEHAGHEFGKPKNDEINIYSKMSSSLIRYISEAVSVIEWDR